MPPPKITAEGKYTFTIDNTTYDNLDEYDQHCIADHTKASREKTWLLKLSVLRKRDSKFYHYTLRISHEYPRPQHRAESIDCRIAYFAKKESVS
jgi:hypothetical protein